MPGTKEIKRRIISVKNTKKITKAMELVAASKMKRAVASTLNSRLYARYSYEILASIAKNTEEIKHPFFNEQESGKTLIILITSNRGLCGAYNAQVIRKTMHMLKELTGEIEIVTIGKKGNVAMQRIGQNIKSTFTEIPDNITLLDIVPLSKFIMDEYRSINKKDKNENRVYSKVFMAYTDFVSALTQKANIKQILPIPKSSLKEMIDAEIRLSQDVSAKLKIDYLFEGNQEELISSLAEKIIRMQIYQMLLESNASEQSSRMIAMKNASDASGEMIDDLTLVFNKVRQSNITREISEISAGMASVN